MSSKRCAGTVKSGKWPYIIRCILRSGHPGMCIYEIDGENYMIGVDGRLTKVVSECQIESAED